MKNVSSETKCTFTVAVPVINESGRINSLIDHIRTLSKNNSCEIIIADGDPEGSTINAITHPDIIKLKSPKGRAKQMNNAATKACGDFIIFLHADTELPDDAFEKIKSAFKNDTYVAGAFSLGINSDRWVFKIISSVANFLTRISRVPYGDQAIFIRKEYFERIGNFKDIPMMEDVELLKRIRRRGDKIKLLPDCVKTSARRWEEEGLIYTTVRNSILLLLYQFGVSPDKLVRYYRVCSGNKLNSRKAPK